MSRVFKDDAESRWTVPKKPLPQQPGEILTTCDGYRPIRDANRLLKAHGLVIRTRGSRAELGDQVYIRLERLPPMDDGSDTEYTDAVALKLALDAVRKKGP